MYGNAYKIVLRDYIYVYVYYILQLTLELDRVRGIDTVQVKFMYKYHRPSIFNVLHPQIQPATDCSTYILKKLTYK